MALKIAGVTVIDDNRALQNITNLNTSIDGLSDAYYADGNLYLGGEKPVNFTTAVGATAVGVSALRSNTTGQYNTAIGSNVLQSNTTGTNNTAIGFWASRFATTGSNNTTVGRYSSPSTNTANNEVTLGNSSITALRCQVTSITSLSDARDKTNVHKLDAGLSFINALNPVRFDWNMRDGGKVGIADTGFIAQELKKAQEDTGMDIPGLVYEENPEKLEAAYSKILPSMVKAIQELSAQVEALKKRLGE
jgi:hypothetical protein